MKRPLVLLAGLLAFACTSSAVLLFSEPFTYDNGALTSVSSGVWSNHSGSAQLMVDSGSAVLSQNLSEDVNRGLPGAPYGTNGYLYASFTVNFSTLPAAAGAYFAHFKDTGTFNLKARAFATTAGAASGSYRVGVANGGNSPTYVPFDLATNALYTLVVRWDTTNATSTLWINPASETSTFNRTDGTDTTANVPIYSFALRQASGIGILNLDNLKVGTAFTDVYTPPTGTTNPPIASAIGNQSIPVNSSTPVIAFTVDDNESGASNLVVTAISSNPTLVPNGPPNILLGGYGTDRTITITPAATQQGVAVITVTVTDTDGNKTTRTFSVTVGAPTISAVANQITRVSTDTAPIAFTVWDAETPGNLNVNGYSTTPGLVSSFQFSGSDSNRTVVIRPVAGQSGLTTIHLVVSDGSSSASNSFTLTVAPTAPLELSEPFAYSNGPIQTVCNPEGLNPRPWVIYSPATASNDCRVLGEQLFLASTNSDDTSILTWGDNEYNGYYATNVGYVMYYSLTVRLEALPDSGYFALLRDGGTFNFRARLYAGTNGAAPGAYRIGIANGAATASTFVASDLALNSTYTITVRYNVGTAETRVWVNALDEASPGVNATDFTTPIPIYNFAFRQNAGIGAVSVDNLKIGTAWDQVYQAPNSPPTISPIADQVTPYQTPTPVLSVTVGDLETPSADLRLSAASTNTLLVPTNNILLGGSGSDRTVRVTPAPGQSGATLVTLTVTDAGGNIATESFLVTVLAPNNPPLFSPMPIPAQNILVDTATPAIPFTVWDLETPPENLILGCSSTNTLLVPNNNILLGGSGSNLTVTVTPLPGQWGTTAISITAFDGVFTTTNTFTVNVSQALILADNFAYPDGSLITNSAFLWNAHSGATGQTQVIQGRVALTAAQSEDVNALLTNAPYTAASGLPVYAGFTVNFTTLPGSNYFAHFKDAAQNFRAKVHAMTSGVTPGYLRLGVTASANNLSATNLPYPLDLSTNTPYRVVIRYLPATGASTIWINATNEAALSVTSTDNPPSLSDVAAFAWRQAAGIGALTVDDLLVGLSFATVKGEVPAPPVQSPPLAIAHLSNVIQVSWPSAATAAGYLLLTNNNLSNPGGWLPSTLPVATQGSSSLVSLTNATGNTFFQLRK